jgi:hypothetical protein
MHFSSALSRATVLKYHSSHFRSREVLLCKRTRGGAMSCIVCLYCFEALYCPVEIVEAQNAFTSGKVTAWTGILYNRGTAGGEIADSAVTDPRRWHLYVRRFCTPGIHHERAEHICESPQVSRPLREPP